MNISDSTLSKFCLLAACIFAIGGGYLHFIDQFNNINLFIATGVVLAFLFYSYQLSARYKQNNTINNLITRDGELLVCRSAGSVSNFKISTSVIETITILDGYFSIVEKNNGNGFDIFTQNKASEIRLYLLSLFSDEELNRIKVSCDA